MAVAGRSTSSNLEALGLVLERDFISIVDTSTDQTPNLLGRGQKRRSVSTLSKPRALDRGKSKS